MINCCKITRGDENLGIVFQYKIFMLKNTNDDAQGFAGVPMKE